MCAAGKTKCEPRLVTYAPVIEEAISLIEYEIPEFSSTIPKRWIALKLLDGNEKILDTTQENISIDLNSENISSSLTHAQDLLNKSNITSSNFKDNIVSNIMFEAESICKNVVTILKQGYSGRDRKIDKKLTSKKYGIPIMIIFLGIIFWLTIAAANVPSQMLSNLFGLLEDKLLLLFEWLKAPAWVTNLLIFGMYKTVTWVIAVMLPPMAIFFPLFTILEDLGYLPRIAFNLDGLFKKACTTGKQALTMCMGFGCNAAGVIRLQNNRLAS